MSNLKVSVAWDTPTVFAGEELKCTITFRNTAPDPLRPLNNGGSVSVSHSRTPSATPTAGLRGKEWGVPTGRAGRPPPLLADAKKKPGHRQTVSLNTPTTTRHPHNPPTPTNDSNSRRGSQTPKNSHKRSISIVSHGSVENGPREGSTAPITTTQRRGSHTRAASYHGSPNRTIPGAQGTIPSKSNGGPLSAGLRSPRAPPLVRAATAHATKSSLGHADPTKSPLFRDVGEELDEAAADDASHTTENPPSPFGANLTAPLRSRPFPSPIPQRDRLHDTPLQRVLSPIGTEPTPRSSIDLMSNYSEDTMVSEYVHGLRAAQQPRHTRQASQLSTISSVGSVVESLMMAYVQLQGSFVLDNSLIDQGPFEAAKQMGVIGGQGSGGVVGVGTQSKRTSGILGSFGLSSIGSSFGGILGGQDLSSMRDMKGIANTKSVPLICTPQSILFVDLQLGPGQSKSFTYKHKLPPDLPPSHKGRAVKIDYQLLVGTQRAQTVGQKNNMRQVQMPFRLFPAITFSGGHIPHDLTDPHVLLRDLAITKAINERHKKQPEPPGKQNSIIQTKASFLKYTAQLLQSSQDQTGEALLSPTEARRESRLLEDDYDDDANKDFTMRELVELNVTRPPMSTVPSSSSRSTNTFAIQRAGHPMAVISIVRPSYRLGDTVTAVVDLSNSYSHIFSLNVFLETEEIVDEAIALRSASSIRRATRRMYGHANEVTIHQRRAVFGFMIPWNATPEFVTSGVKLEWKLRFEFVTSVAPKSEEDLMEEVGRDDRGSLYAALQELYTESFEVSVPLKVFGAEGGYNGRKDTEHGI